jgi:hypothetical protein
MVAEKRNILIATDFCSNGNACRSPASTTPAMAIASATADTNGIEFASVFGVGSKRPNQCGNTLSQPQPEPPRLNFKIGA